jgi:preprotein translocase subunit SecG
MLAFVIVLQVLVALFLIMVVLLQPGNRGGASAALGGAGSDTVFGGRGANTFLSKITFGAAVCFMVTNFALSYMSSTGGDKSVLDALEKSSGASAGSASPEAPVVDGEKAAEPAAGEAATPPAAEPVKDEAAPTPEAPTPDPAPEGEKAAE